MSTHHDTISHERLQTAIAAAGIGTWDLNPVTGDLFWSDHSKYLLGIPAAAVVNYPLFLQQVHPDDRAATAAAVQHALDAAGTGTLDVDYRTLGTAAGGSSRWLRATGRAYFDANHARAVRLVGTITDVTAAKEIALRFQLLAENLPVMVATTDGAGQIEYSNQRLLDYTGLSLAQLVEQWGTLIHPADLPAVGATWSNALQTGQPYEVEYRLRRRDEQYRWMLSSTRPTLGPDGRPVTWVSGSIDIHERQTTVRNLEQLLASDLIGILFWDLDDPAVLEANDEYLRIINYSREDLQAKRVDWHAMTPPEYYERDEQAIEEINRTGKHRPYEKEYVGPDGRRVPVLLGGALTEPGTRKGVSFCFDITPQKEAQRQVQVREREFAALVNTVAQLSWMAEPDGHIFWYNDRWYDYTGTNLAEMQGWGWEKVHHPKHVERVVSFVRAAWSVGEPWELTFPLRGRDGDYRWFLTRAVPILDEQGSIMRWFGTNTDVTEMRELQNQLERSYQDLELKVTFRNLQLERELRELRAQLNPQ